MAGKDDNSVFIGRRTTNNYVLAAMMVLRGRAISHAVDVAEVLRNRFMKDLVIKDIEIGTEQLPDRDGRESNVSYIEITVEKSK